MTNVTIADPAFIEGLEAFAKARAALASDECVAARLILDDLAAAHPDDVELRLYAAWARAQSSAPSVAELEAVESLARRALTHGESLALPLSVLGHAALRRGELRAARGLFRRAVAAEPASIDARRGARIAERRLSRLPG